MDRRRIHRRFTRELDDDRVRPRKRSMKDQVMINNIIGIIAVIFIIVFAFDIGGWATRLGMWITGGK